MPGQQYVTNTLGGYTSVPYLTDKLRSVAQPMYRFRQLVDVQEAIGKNRGDTWLFDKTSNVATAGVKLAETATVPVTNFTINQGTGTISEYANSIPYTGKLEALGQFQINPIVDQKLRDDMVKVLESAAGAEFVGTDYIAVCASTASVTFTTNGTATATAGANLTAFNTRQIVDYMRKKLIPKYNGRDYMCVASVQALQGLHSDTGQGGWVDVSKYNESTVKAIFDGEVGTYYMTKFLEETGYLSNAIGTGAAFGQAVFLGADAVYEAVAVPEEMRVKTSIDYGRDQGLAWYALLGWKRVWNLAADGEQHIVFVTSA